MICVVTAYGAFVPMSNKIGTFVPVVVRYEGFTNHAGCLGGMLGNILRGMDKA